MSEIEDLAIIVVDGPEVEVIEVVSEGPIGPPGEKGDTGEKGDPGDAGFGGQQEVFYVTHIGVANLIDNEIEASQGDGTFITATMNTADTFLDPVDYAIGTITGVGVSYASAVLNGIYVSTTTGALCQLYEGSYWYNNLTGGSSTLSDATPSSLGVSATPGISTEASRADHIHELPGIPPVTAHADLTGRSTADSHPQSAITGLDDALTAKLSTYSNLSDLSDTVQALANLGLGEANEASGWAQLDGAGKILESIVPSSIARGSEVSSAIAALVAGAAASGDTLSELHTRLVAVEALGSGYSQAFMLGGM